MSESESQSTEEKGSKQAQVYDWVNYILNYPYPTSDFLTTFSLKELDESDTFKKKLQPFLVNRYISMYENISVSSVSYILNRYVFRFHYNKMALFELMCKLTPAIPKRHFIRYLKKPTESTTYPKELLNISKRFYGEFNSKKDILEILDYVRDVIPQEFCSLCLGSGMTYKEIIKNFPELENKIGETKLSSKDIKDILSNLPDKTKSLKRKGKGSAQPVEPSPEFAALDDIL